MGNSRGLNVNKTANSTFAVILHSVFWHFIGYFSGLVKSVSLLCVTLPHRGLKVRVIGWSQMLGLAWLVTSSV